MINEITFGSHKSFLSSPPVTSPLFTTQCAGIIIGDSHWSGMARIRSYLTPSMQLDFSNYQPIALLKGNVLGQDKFLRKAQQQKVEQIKGQLPSDREAQKILLFADGLEVSKQSYHLYILCQTGIDNSASIAKFLISCNALQGCTACKGLDCLTTDGHNQFLSGLLAYNYSKWISERITNDANADSKPTIRR